MNKNDALETGSKLLSVYAFVHGWTALQTPIIMRDQAINMRVSTTSSAALFIPAAILFLFSGILWLSARSIEARSPAAESAPGVTPQLIQSIVFSAIGILILVDSVAPLANMVMLWGIHGENRSLNINFYFRIF